jgi:outer membrane receptor protein involved in Fe transport
LTQKDYDLTTDGQLVYTSVYGNTPSFVETTGSTDKEVAGYGNLDFNVTSQLKLTAGVRVSKTTFDYTQTGIFNPYPLTPVSGSAKNTPVTPKFGASYLLDANNFFYVSAAKGFRPGGVNPTLPDLCGHEPAAENVAYQPDSLWSYEIGGKSTVFGGRVQLDSGLYEISWKNIQQSVRYTNCGFSFVGNLGSATGYGADISTRVEVTDDVLVGFSASYTEISHDQTILEGAGAIVAKESDKVGGPPFNLSAFGRYKFDMFGKNAFCRVDYTYHNKTPAVDPATVNYDSTLPNIGSNEYLTMRVGVYFSGWELSVYGNNLTEERAPLAIAHDIAGSEPYYVSTYRPMTFGVTAAYHY